VCRTIAFHSFSESNGAVFGALCRDLGISRQTGCTWLARYGEGGAGAVLFEKSRRSQRSPIQISGEINAAVVSQRWPDWGARKLNKLLVGRQPELGPVGDNSIQRILERHGLVREQWDRDLLAKSRRELPGQLGVRFIGKFTDYQNVITRFSNLSGCLRPTCADRVRRSAQNKRAVLNGHLRSGHDAFRFADPPHTYVQTSHSNYNLISDTTRVGVELIFQSIPH
jgi:hypothetical protein